MKIPQMDYFLTLCETMNFTEAAKQLYISQPALSKQIAAIERELDVTLFDRSNRNLTLTPAGEYLRDSFSKIQADYTASVTMCQKIHSNCDNRVTLGFVTGWNVANFVPNITSLLDKNNPDLRISFQCLGGELLLQSFAENAVDIAVLPTALIADMPGVKFRELGRVHSRLFFSRMHPVAKTRSFGFEDFQKEIFFVLPEAQRCSTIQHLLDACAEYNFAPVTEVLPNLESVISCLQSGIGVALFDTLHKLSDNPSFRSIDLPHTTSLCVAWKDSPRGSLHESIATKLTLIER